MIFAFVMIKKKIHKILGLRWKYTFIAKIFKTVFTKIYKIKLLLIYSKFQSHIRMQLTFLYNIYIYFNKNPSSIVGTFYMDKNGPVRNVVSLIHANR